MQSVYLIICFLASFYIVVSLFEWISHYYFMHYNGFMKTVIDKLGLKIENSHVEHHKQVHLDQTMPPDNYNEEGLVFNFIDTVTLVLFGLAVTFISLFWNYFPDFKNHFSFTAALILMVLLLSIFLWSWGSIHTRYHNVYVDTNKRLKNSKNVIYSPLKLYVPDVNNSIYRFLYWYHTIHHLNKGESKTNYNVMFPLFDFIFMTYSGKVNNTLHFSKNSPRTPQEVWLQRHLEFEIRIVGNNVVEYKDEYSGKWKTFPKNI